MTVTATPLTSSVDPIAAGLSPNTRFQYSKLITATGGADAESSDGAKVRPSAAGTPSTLK